MSLSGDDPRLTADAAAPFEADPVVGRAAGGRAPWLAAGGFVLAFIVLFLALNAHRLHRQSALTTMAAAPEAAVSAPPPLQMPASAAPPAPVTPLPPPPVAPVPGPVAAAPIPPPPASPQDGQRVHAPALVVDLGQAGEARPAQTQAAGAAASSPAAAGAAATAASAGASANDQFADRLEDATPGRARAVQMGHLGALVPQGTIIAGVLETAIDSDLPGYTRAVVSRDVRSFDGKAVLIPRGSRLIGQYKSGVSQGATRAFVIWTRIIRSDGVSIQIGSPGTDPLGRGGLTGKVDTHFFQRFSGSILLSVLNAGVAAVSRAPSTTVTIGSSGAAVGAANSVQGDAIPPTIKVAQGSAVDIFVARDLDFSDVGPVK